MVLGVKCRLPMKSRAITFFGDAIPAISMTAPPVCIRPSMIRKVRVVSSRPESMQSLKLELLVLELEQSADLWRVANVSQGPMPGTISQPDAAALRHGSQQAPDLRHTARCPASAWAVAGNHRPGADTRSLEAGADSLPDNQEPVQQRALRRAARVAAPRAGAPVGVQQRALLGLVRQLAWPRP